MVAGLSLMKTSSGKTGFGVNGGVGETVVNFPVTPAGDVCPSPVKKSETTLPGAAGLFGPLPLESWFRIAPGPVPEASAVNNAGFVAAIEIEKLLDTPLA